MSSAEFDIEPPRSRQEIVEGIIVARQDGAHLHDLPPDAKRLLAENGMYTSEEPRAPQSFRDFRIEQGRERAMRTIAERTFDALSEVPEFRRPLWRNRAGTVLRKTFLEVDGIHGEDIHAIGEENKPSHTVIVPETTFFTSPENVNRLGGAMQALLRKRKGLHVVYTDPDNGMVKVNRMTEHSFRSLGRAVGTAVAYEDNDVGVRLPPEKWPLVHWMGAGETFSPEWQRRLQEADDAYQRLSITATYRQDIMLAPIRDDHLVGTDAAPVFQGLRNMANGLIWATRGSSKHNLEQEPNPDWRPLLEEGINLRRDPVSVVGSRLGPPTSRQANAMESARERVEDTLADAKRHPGRLILDLASVATGGVVDLSIAALGFVPGVTAAGARLKDDAIALRDRKQAVKLSDGRLDELVSVIQNEATS